MATGTLMTAEQFDQLPVVEGRKSELLEGELVELSSSTFLHNYILWILGVRLGPVLLGLRLGVAVSSTEFVFGDSRFQPDLAVLLSGKWKQWDLGKVPVRLIPDIAVEVISPSESATHVERKTRIYLEHGVAEVWCIYPDDRRIYIHRQDSIRMLKEDETLSTPLLPDWSVTVRDLFPVQ